MTQPLTREAYGSGHAAAEALRVQAARALHLERQGFVLTPLPGATDRLLADLRRIGGAS